MRRFCCIVAAILFLSNSFLLNISAGEEQVLSWLDCVKEAAKLNPVLISSREVINQSKANKDIQASGLMPQITTGLSTTQSNSPSSKGAKTSTSNSYDVTGTQLLFDGFKTVDNTMAARETIKASQFSYKFTSASVRFSLRSAFINLLRAQELIVITNDIQKIRKKNLDLIKLRYDSGIEHKGALMTAEANLAQAVYQVKQAERELSVARRNLIKEMGRYEDMSLKVKGDFTVVEKLQERPDFFTLAKENPSVKQFAAQTKSAYYNLRAAQADFFPTISALGSAGRADSRWLPQTNQWNIGLSLSFPIFEGGQRIAQVSLTKAQLKEAEANERNTRDNVILTLERAWRDLEDAVDNAVVQKKFLEANEERSRIANAQYSIGFITFDNWTIIEDNLVQSKTTYVNAEAAALVAEANWLQAKGETLEYEK